MSGGLQFGEVVHGPRHGEPCGAEVLDWQEGYINTFLAAVTAADWSDVEGARAAVIARMLNYLPSGALQFLMELSIDPVGSQLGAR